MYISCTPFSLLFAYKIRLYCQTHFVFDFHKHICLADQYLISSINREEFRRHRLTYTYVCIYVCLYIYIYNWIYDFHAYTHAILKSMLTELWYWRLEIIAAWLTSDVNLIHCIECCFLNKLDIGIEYMICLISTNTFIWAIDILFLRSREKCFCWQGEDKTK